MPLQLQMHFPSQGGWTTVGVQDLHALDGTMSHNGPAGREIYRFRCCGSHSEIERSVGGADLEVSVLRRVDSLGYETVARLTPEAPDLEFWLKTDRMPQPARFRFHHAA